MQSDKQYRVNVTPRSARATFSPELKCLYGVSVGGHKNSIKDQLSAYEWAASQFSECRILLGDGLYRITLQIQRGLTAEAAEVKAGQAGDELLERFSSLHGAPIDHVVRSSELMKTASFDNYLSTIRTIFNSNQIFATSIHSDARRFVLRQAVRQRLAIAQARAVDLAIQYLQEEIAVYLLLAEQGWLIDVYLGQELPTLARIIAGKIPDVPVALTKRINISLTRRGIRTQ